ncbi:putative uncharacterized protein MYH16 [Pollicipes pollicipes]|uniref:putative uncharacterized protein MYH16 n=1 Tax=Pollicipes pollicipes TaxID=41117 RepID=UPI0018855915|nr:putative uncharacterized protein MYH16 [Pollicipes pollicipes]
MELLSEQIESNMTLLQKLSYYVAQAEKLNEGHSRTQNTYAQLLNMTEMKRKELLMYRTMLLDTSKAGEQMRTETVKMRHSIVQMIRAASLEQLLEEQFVQDSEVQIIHLQDVVTQTKNKIEKIKSERKRHVLRKNKAVQLERRLRQRTDHVVVELRRLEVLQTDAEQSMEDRTRSHGTLVRHRSGVSEHVQTMRTEVRRVQDLLDEHRLEQLEMEAEAAEVDISPLLQELQTLEKELEVTTERERQSRRRYHELRRRRHSMTSQRDWVHAEMTEFLETVNDAHIDLANIDGDRETVMSVLKEQMEMADDLLEASREKWAEIQDVHGQVQADLDQVREKIQAMEQELTARGEETKRIVSETHAELERAVEVQQALSENTEEEANVLDHLNVVVAEIKDGSKPALQQIRAQLAELAAQSDEMHALRGRLAKRLTQQKTETAVRGREAAALQQEVDDMRQQHGQQLQTAVDLQKLKREQARDIAERNRWLQTLQASFSELTRRLSAEQLEQEQLITRLRTWCRQVALCNGGYQIEIARMKNEMKNIYDKMELAVLKDVEYSTNAIARAEKELKHLTELHNQKHAASMDRDWQLRAALLASSQAADHSLQPVHKTMTGLDLERRKLVRMVQAAVNMRPFGKVQVDIEQPICPLPEQDE